MTLLFETPLIFLFILPLLIAVAISLEIEREGWATTFFSVSIALLLWNYWSDIWSWVSTNPTNTIQFIVLYLLLGIVWAFTKWKTYLSRTSRHFKFLGEQFKREVGEIGANWSPWINKLNDNRSKLNIKEFVSFGHGDEPEDIVKKITASASDKKSLIVSWIAYWPMSIVATLLNDPVKRLVSFIYNGISGLFQRMSDNSTKNLAKDINMHKRYEEKDQKK